MFFKKTKMKYYSFFRYENDLFSIQKRTPFHKNRSKKQGNKKKEGGGNVFFKKTNPKELSFFDPKMISLT